MLHRIGSWIDTVTRSCGGAVAWLSLALALVVCTLVITWFALYALYRLVTDDS